MSRIEAALEKALQLREAPATAEAVRLKNTADPSPVFPAVPAAVAKEQIDAQVVAFHEPSSAAAEQYRKLKTRVLKSTKDGFRNALLITSANVGEGKTLTAVNLAVAMANEIDHTVLLIDADLRHPSVHACFGLSPARGLSDYLKGEAALEEVLIPTGIGKLVLLPAGNPTRQSAELLSSERMRGLIRELKERYRDRYLIFDSSPLLVTADTVALGSDMDGVLFVIQEGSTSQKSARQAFDLMKGWQMLGAVFNNVPPSLLQNNYPYYYRSDRAKSRQQSDRHDTN